MKVKERKIKTKEIEFIKPIIGFEEYKFFIFEGKEKSPFIWMKSVEKKYLEFILINLFDFFPDYKVELSNEDKTLINYEDSMLIFGIVNIPENIEDMTVNLKAPIIVNVKTKKAGQFVNLIEEYSLKERLIKNYKKR